MDCLNESDLQGYLEESGPTPLRQKVESHMVSCAECRAAFDRLVATHQRVNVWLSELSSPAEDTAVNAPAALQLVLNRIANAPPAPATISAEDHLARLLAPDTEVPWYKTIYGNIHDWIRPPELPPLELTSTPVAVRDIWGEGTNPKRVAASVLFHGAVFATLILVGTNDKVQKAIKNVVLMAPPPPVTKVKTEIKNAGGGQRSPLPAMKAALPRPAPKVFTPPLVTIDHPALTMDASLVTQTDPWSATAAIGNPLGTIGGGGGFGSGGGLGNGRGTGIGNGSGSGVGGNGSGIYSVGNGTTPPAVLSKVDPEYSEEARKAKYSGSVMLSIVVNTDGKAEDIKVVKSLGMGLDEKAIEAVQKWRFTPGKNKGQPVKVRAQIEVNFRLL